jgi:hypothetical protein
MTYYVVFEPSSGTLYGLTTIDGYVPPDQYILESREGDLPKSISLWDTTSRSFNSVNEAITKLQFLSRFTTEERIAIRQHAMTDPVIDDFLKLLDISQEVDVKSEMTQQGLQYLVYKGIILANRVSEIGA